MGIQFEQSLDGANSTTLGSSSARLTIPVSTGVGPRAKFSNINFAEKLAPGGWASFDLAIVTSMQQWVATCRALADGSFVPLRLSYDRPALWGCQLSSRGGGICEIIKRA